MRPPSATAPVRRDRTCRFALVVALVLLGAALPSTAGAQSPATPAVAPAAPPAAPLAPPSPDLPGLPALSPDLTDVVVSGAAFEQAARRYADLDASHAQARDRRTALDHRATVVQTRLDQLRAAQVVGSARLGGIASRLEAVEGAIQELAVRAYTGASATGRVEEALMSETPSINDSDRRALLGEASLDVLLAERAAYQERAAATEEQVSAAAEEEATLAAELRSLQSDRAAGVDEERVTGEQVATQRVRYEEARVLAKVRGVDFQLVALDAYHRAAATVGAERPTCGLRWWALAGVSKVEGRHGTYGGAVLDAHGEPSRRIIGIQLNGTNDTAVIPDSDGGRIDGDPLFDRAVGPMQFIPQTWARFAADGNGDGEMSPFNLYDATLAAANYLCTASGGLEGDDGLRRAYLAYNRSLAYVESVLGHARGYERSLVLPAPGS